MAFEPSKWADGAAGGTPITAEELNRIEAAGAGKAEESHNHAASDITSGTFAAARIPALAQNKVTGLATVLADLESRLAAVEAALDPGA